MMAVKKNKQSTFPKWMGPLLDALRQLGGSGRPKEVTNQVAKNLFDYLKLINQFKSIIIDLVISFICFIGINSFILITFFSLVFKNFN